MILALLAACSPEMIASDSAPEWLADEAVFETAERARVVRYGEARLTPDGEPFSAPSYSFTEDVPEVSVVEVGDGVRLVHDIGGVRLMFWPDPDDLQEVVVEPVWTSSAPGPRKGATGALVPAGTPVAEAGARYVRVEASDPILEVEGWLPVAAVDRYYVRPPEFDAEIEDRVFSEPEADDPGTVGYLRGGTEILDAPGGSPIARLARPDFDAYWARARLVGDFLEGWQEVEVEGYAITARGYVRSGEVSSFSNGGWGTNGSIGFARCGGFGSFGSPSVPEGTWLRASPGGEVVGLAMQPLYVDLAVGEEGTSFSWDTPWGVTTLWL